MKRRNTFLLLSIIATFGPLQARDFEETAMEILMGSPSYQSGVLSLESAESSLKSVSNLPDPELGGEFLAAPADETDRWAAELSWDLEWPGVYNARKQEADSRKTAARNALTLQRLDNLLEIKRLLLDYIFSTKKLQILDGLTASNDSLTVVAQEAAKSGEMTVLDLNKLRLENANLRASHAVTADERMGALTSLSSICGYDCTRLLQEMECEFPPMVMPAENEMTGVSLNSPALVAAMSEVEIAKAAGKVTSREALPGISFGYKHAYEDGTHFNGATLGISVPIFSSRHKREAAKASLKEAEFNAEAMKMSADAEVSALLAQLHRMNERIAEITEIIDSTDHNALLLKAYSGGVITLLDYLTERNYFVNARLELLGLIHSACMTRLSLDKYL